MHQNQLIQSFKNNDGWLRSKDFGYQPNIYTLLNKMIEKGGVERVKSGLFRYIGNENYDEMEAIKVLYPNGVLCLFSAWQYYGLSATVASQYHVAFPHKANPPKVDYPPAQFYYWSEVQFNLGISKLNKIRIYDIEKSVCDAVKFRNKIGDEITYEVLKNYMNRKDRNIEKLMTYSGKMRIKNIISPMLKAML